jgi:hypothetical protein
MIGKNEIKSHVFGELETYFRGIGFKKSVAQQAFYRKTDGGREAFHIALVARPDGVELKPDLALRIDVVEELIFENTTGLVADEQRKNTFTIGVPLTDTEQSSGWLVTRLDDLSLTSKAIVREFERVGLPFFREYADPAQLYEVLSSFSPEAKRLCPVPISQALITLGLAFLLGRYEDLDALALTFELELAANDDPSHPVFQQFRDRLRAKVDEPIEGSATSSS